MGKKKQLSKGGLLLHLKKSACIFNVNNHTSIHREEIQG